MESSLERSINTTRKTQYDEEEETEQEPDTDTGRTGNTEDHELDETKEPNQKGMAETSTQKQKETKIDTHQEKKSSPLPKETQATT